MYLVNNGHEYGKSHDYVLQARERTPLELHREDSNSSKRSFDNTLQMITVQNLWTKK